MAPARLPDSQMSVQIDTQDEQEIELTLLDEWGGQTRFQGALLPHLLVRVDVWPNPTAGEDFISLVVYNAFDDIKSGHISSLIVKYKGEVEQIDDFRYMCGYRKTWGERPKGHSNQTIHGYEPQFPADLDWSEPEGSPDPIPPMKYGKYLTSYLGTGSRPMIGIRAWNMIQDKGARIRYAENGCGLPIHTFSTTWPHKPIVGSGYTMGFNEFSLKGNNEGKLKIKVDGAHLSNQFFHAALEEMDRFFIDETVILGNFAVMHRNKLASGQVREQGRDGVAALQGWLMGGAGAFVEEEIHRAVNFYEGFTNNITGIPSGRKFDTGKSLYYTPWWEFIYLAYFLFEAEQHGFIKRSAYLDALIDFQLGLGARSPYWINLEIDAPVEGQLEYISATATGLRQAEARVWGWILEQRGFKSPWPLNEIPDRSYPIKDHIDFRIVNPPSPGPPEAGDFFMSYREWNLQHAGEQWPLSPLLSFAQAAEEPPSTTSTTSTTTTTHPPTTPPPTSPAPTTTTFPPSSGRLVDQFKILSDQSAKVSAAEAVKVKAFDEMARLLSSDSDSVVPVGTTVKEMERVVSVFKLPLK